MQTPCLSACSRSPGWIVDAADRHRLAEIDEPHVSVAHARVQTEELEAEGPHLVEVAGAAAGDVAHAAELLVDGRGDLAELGSQPWRVVDVLAHRDLGPWLGGDIAEVIGQQVRRLLPGRWRSRLGLARDRVADDHPELGQQAPDRMRQEAEMPGANVEQLDRVRDRRRVVPPKRFELLGTEVGRGHRGNLRAGKSRDPCGRSSPGGQPTRSSRTEPVSGAGGARSAAPTSWESVTVRGERNGPLPPQVRLGRAGRLARLVVS